MDAVEIRKALDGGYWITARSDTLAEAMWAVDAMLGKSSAAFDAVRAAVLGPPDFPPRSFSESEAPPLTPEQEARLDAMDPPEPIESLNVEKVP